MSLQELSNFSVTKETNDEPETKLEGSEMTHKEENQVPITKRSSLPTGVEEQENVSADEYGNVGCRII